VKRVLLICLLVIGSFFASPAVSGAKSAELTKAQAVTVLNKNWVPYTVIGKKFIQQMSTIKATTPVKTIISYFNPFIAASDKFASFLSTTVWPGSLAPSFANFAQLVSALSTDLQSYTLDPQNGTPYVLQGVKDIKAATLAKNELSAALQR